MTGNLPAIVLAAACVALNVAIGTLVYLLKLPLYLDQPGIMLAALLAPGSRGNACMVSITVAVVTFVVIGLIANPFIFWYIGTAVVSAIYGSLVVRGRVAELISDKANGWRFWGQLLLFGIGWGVVAAVVSAPITVFLFGGVTGAGTTVIVAFLVRAGNQILDAVLLTGLSAEPIDKTLSLLLAIVVARATPPAFIDLLEARRERPR
jgi:energy-coupling factor transport system substrate-specific component